MNRTQLKIVRDEQAGGEVPADERAASDDVLSFLVKAGDQRAFAEIVERYQPLVRRVCYYMVRDEQRARELAQEVFLNLWRKRADYRPEGKLRQLLLTMARNACRSQLRRQRILSFIGLEARHTETLGDPSDTLQALSDKQCRKVVALALARLDEKFRLPLLLRFHEELSYEEIALIIQRTPSAARSRVHYGLKQLKSLLPEEVCR